MPDLNDGEMVEMKGSSAKPYILRNVGGVYSCTCPAWRNQSTLIEKRTCKHLRKLRGDAAEQARIGQESESGASETVAEEASESKGPPLLLAESWDNTLDLTDWWMSEKLDGVRAYWDGREFRSRQGNKFHAPAWFVEGLPDSPLDGELWIDRKKFQRTVSIVRRQDQSDHWREVRFLIFDAPALDHGFEERMAHLVEQFRDHPAPFANVHEQHLCQGIDHVRTELDRIQSLQGEGLMLREPKSRYAVGRSTTLLKVKRFHDGEAVVMEHQPGKGKHKGKMGAVLVQTKDGTLFSVGTGFSDAMRANPPAIGTTITYRYQELTDAGMPRFPSFVRIFTG